jgi:hypothetical protein
MNQNQYEGMCEIALKEEGIIAKPMWFPGDETIYYPEVRDGITICKLPKKHARHQVSAKPGRWVFLGTEKHDILVNNPEGCNVVKTFYPWKRDFITKAVMDSETGKPKLDENDKPIYEKIPVWTELTNTK